MEFVNKTEIVGRVGSVQIQQVNGVRVGKLTVYTETYYRAQGSDLYVDRDWHYVTAWSGTGIADLITIGKGDWVHVVGRLRTTAVKDTDARFVEILAHNLEKIDGDE